MFDVFFFFLGLLTPTETNPKVSKTSRLLVLILLYIAQYKRREDVLSNEWRGITKDCAYFFILFFFFQQYCFTVYIQPFGYDRHPPPNE